MKIVLTQERGDNLLIYPKEGQLITDIDDKSILKEKYRDICLIDQPMSLEQFAAVFCMLIPKCVEITLDNIDNSKITLYTFTDDCQHLNMDVAKMRIQNTSFNIAEHFLRHISTVKFGCCDYKQYISNHCELESEINQDCRRKMECDMKVFRKVNDNCITDEYSLCHNFMKQMVLHAKHRFLNIEKDEIVELPFKKKDYVYYKYNCSYHDIIQVYMIRIILV